MAKLTWLVTANNDLIQIYNYIYEDSIYYAIKTVENIVKLVDNLSYFPYIGRKIPEYNLDNQRDLIYKSYRIIYKIESNEILIRRIWHSSRKMPKDLIS